MKYRVLIVDDEDKLRGLLKRIISLEGYETFEAANLTAARQLLQQQPVDVLLCDVKLPDGNGVDFTKEIKDTYPHLQIILLTAYGNIPDGVMAIKNGAYDYLVKGDDNNKILPLLDHLASEISKQHTVLATLTTTNGFKHIIGTSPAITQAIHLAQKVAPTDASVLLTGETGTGKEIFAQAIHANSHRKANSFVAINCSAFSRDLLESELFGHKAGAFTGAVKDKKGLVEEANGGTLFLDEIGEMPVDLQPKLLRLLENGSYLRVGDTKEQKANVRIITATNRDLKEEINKGIFRNDLYFRIAVFNIQLPALRDRTSDIPDIVRHFVQLFTNKTGKKMTDVSQEALTALMAADWRGNIRELKNTIERAVILEDSNTLSVSSLPFELQSPKTDKESSFSLSAMEKSHITKMLQYTQGNKSEAARLMNIGLATLYRKIDEYSLK